MPCSARHAFFSSSVPPAGNSDGATPCLYFFSALTPHAATSSGLLKRSRRLRSLSSPAAMRSRQSSGQSAGCVTGSAAALSGSLRSVVVLPLSPTSALSSAVPVVSPAAPAASSDASAESPPSTSARSSALISSSAMSHLSLHFAAHALHGRHHFVPLAHHRLHALRVHLDLGGLDHGTQVVFRIMVRHLAVFHVTFSFVFDCLWVDRPSPSCMRGRSRRRPV